MSSSNKTLRQESVIYVPGLGDHRQRQQDKLQILWRKWYGLHTEYFPIGWADNGTFEARLKELEARINHLAPLGPVSLVGVSAGASAVLNTFARRPEIHRLVTICGKIEHPETIQPYRFEKNPNFETSIRLLPESLEALTAEQRSHILCIRPLFDEVVGVQDQVLPGAQTHRIPTIGHMPSIVWAVTVGSGTIANFIRQD